MKKLNKEIWAFLIITLILSSVVNYLIIQKGTLQEAGNALIMAVMWTPGIAAFLSLLLLKQPLNTIAWKPGKFKYLAQSYLIPLLYTTAAYLPLWAFGLFNAEKPMSFQNFIVPVIGPFINMIATFGEEIGWRGYLFPKLEQKMNFTKAALLTGFIWAIWHLPGLLMTDYGNNAAWYSMIPFFMITLTAISLPMSYLCKKAQSVWPAVLFHGAHNAFIQAFYDPFSVRNNISSFLIGETGLALAVVSLVLLVIYLRKSKSLNNQK